MTVAEVFAYTRQRRREAMQARVAALVSRYGETRVFQIHALRPVPVREEITTRTQVRLRALKREGLKKKGRLIARLMVAQGPFCYLCNYTLGDDRKPTLEHVRPRAHGGRSARNVLLACLPCNGKKADRQPTAAELAMLRKVNAVLDHMAHQATAA